MAESQGLPLSKRFTADLGAALGAGFALSWLITPMDAAVTEGASGKATISQSLKKGLGTILTRPHQYIRRPEFGIIFGVYASTYITKNATDSYCTFKNMSNEQASFLKFWTVLGLSLSSYIFKKFQNITRIRYINIRCEWLIVCILERSSICKDIRHQTSDCCACRILFILGITGYSAYNWSSCGSRLR